MVCETSQHLIIHTAPGINQAIETPTTNLATLAQSQIYAEVVQRFAKVYWPNARSIQARRLLPNSRGQGLCARG